MAAVKQWKDVGQSVEAIVVALGPWAKGQGVSEAQLRAVC